MAKDEPPTDPVAQGYGQGYEYLALGFTFAFAILLFGAGGWWLDGRLHTRPLFAIVGGFVGGFAGFMNIYYRVTRETAKDGGGGMGKRER